VPSSRHPACPILSLLIVFVCHMFMQVLPPVLCGGYGRVLDGRSLSQILGYGSTAFSILSREEVLLLVIQLVSWVCVLSLEDLPFWFARFLLKPLYIMLSTPLLIQCAENTILLAACLPGPWRVHFTSLQARNFHLKMIFWKSYPELLLSAGVKPMIVAATIVSAAAGTWSTVKKNV